ncbi:hypothetical protein Tco_1417979 [Tanacetum coccineum]
MSKVLTGKRDFEAYSSTKAKPGDHGHSTRILSEANTNLIRQKKGSYGLKFLEANSYVSSHIIIHTRSRKEPREVILTYYINNVFFDNALADLGARKVTCSLDYLSVVVENIDSYRYQDMGDIILKEPSTKLHVWKQEGFSIRCILVYGYSDLVGKEIDEVGEVSIIGDPWDQRNPTCLGLRKKYRLNLKNDMPSQDRYVVPTGKDNVIVSAVESKVIPAVLYNLNRLEDLSRAGPTSGIRACRKKTRRDPKGNIMILPPVSVEKHIAVQRETKARTILLQSLPEDHMADFHHLDDARVIWLAVKARFGDAAKPTMEDCNMKFHQSTSNLLGHREVVGFKARHSSYQTYGLDKSEGTLGLVVLIDTMLKRSTIKVKMRKKLICAFMGFNFSGFGETFGSDEVFDSSAPSIFDTTPEDVEGKPLYDRFVKAVGMHSVPSPITGTFTPPSNNPDLDDTQ